MPKDKDTQLSPASNIEDLNKQLADLYSELKTAFTNINHTHTKCEDDQKVIVNLYDKIKSEDQKLSNYHRSKLKTAYGNALKSCNTEAGRLRECLEKIDKIRKLKEEKRVALRKQQQHQHPTTMHHHSHGAASSTGGAGIMKRGVLMVLLQKTASTMKLWLGDGQDLAPPPLCGAIPAEPNHVCQPGDLVAARVKAVDGDENWILAEVKLYDNATGKYDVEDIDEEQKERYVLSKKKIIPLPHMRAHPQLNPEAIFELNAVVWALYPQTTCFYKGVVLRRPQGPTDDYLVAFEDNSFATGFSPPLSVQQRYVVAH